MNRKGDFVWVSKKHEGNYVWGLPICVKVSYAKRQFNKHKQNNNPIPLSFGHDFLLLITGHETDKYPVHANFRDNMHSCIKSNTTSVIYRKNNKKPQKQQKAASITKGHTKLCQSRNAVISCPFEFMSFISTHIGKLVPHIMLLTPYLAH